MPLRIQSPRKRSSVKRKSRPTPPPVVVRLPSGSTARKSAEAVSAAPTTEEAATVSQLRPSPVRVDPDERRRLEMASQKRVKDIQDLQYNLRKVTDRVTTILREYGADPSLPPSTVGWSEAPIRVNALFGDRGGESGDEMERERERRAEELGDRSCLRGMLIDARLHGIERDEILDMTLTWLDSVRLTLENLEKVPEADKFEYESSRGTFMDYLGKVSLLLRIVRESGTRQEAGAQDTNQIIERLFSDMSDQNQELIREAMMEAMESDNPIEVVEDCKQLILGVDADGENMEKTEKQSPLLGEVLAFRTRWKEVCKEIHSVFGALFDTKFVHKTAQDNIKRAAFLFQMIELMLGKRSSELAESERRVGTLKVEVETTASKLSRFYAESSKWKSKYDEIIEEVRRSREERVEMQERTQLLEEKLVDQEARMSLMAKKASAMGLKGAGVTRLANRIKRSFRVRDANGEYVTDDDDDDDSRKGEKERVTDSEDEEREGDEEEEVKKYGEMMMTMEQLIPDHVQTAQGQAIERMKHSLKHRANELHETKQQLEDARNLLEHREKRAKHLEFLLAEAKEQANSKDQHIKDLEHLQKLNRLSPTSTNRQGAGRFGANRSPISSPTRSPSPRSPSPRIISPTQQRLRRRSRAKSIQTDESDGSGSIEVIPRHSIDEPVLRGENKTTTFITDANAAINAAAAASKDNKKGAGLGKTPSKLKLDVKRLEEVVRDQRTLMSSLEDSYRDDRMKIYQEAKQVEEVIDKFKEDLGNSLIAARFFEEGDITLDVPIKPTRSSENLLEEVKAKTTRYAEAFPVIMSAIDQVISKKRSFIQEQEQVQTQKMDITNRLIEDEKKLISHVRNFQGDFEKMKDDMKELLESEARLKKQLRDKNVLIARLAKNQQKPSLTTDDANSKEQTPLKAIPLDLKDLEEQIARQLSPTPADAGTNLEKRDQLIRKLDTVDNELRRAIGQHEAAVRINIDLDSPSATSKKRTTDSPSREGNGRALPTTKKSTSQRPSPRQSDRSEKRHEQTPTKAPRRKSALRREVKVADREDDDDATTTDVDRSPSPQRPSRRLVNLPREDDDVTDDADYEEEEDEAALDDDDDDDDDADRRSMAVGRRSATESPSTLRLYTDVEEDDLKTAAADDEAGIPIALARSSRSCYPSEPAIVPSKYDKIEESETDRRRRRRQQQRRRSVRLQESRTSTRHVPTGERRRARWIGAGARSRRGLESLLGGRGGRKLSISQLISELRDAVGSGELVGSDGEKIDVEREVEELLARHPELHRHGDDDEERVDLDEVMEAVSRTAMSESEHRLVTKRRKMMKDFGKLQERGLFYVRRASMESKGGLPGTTSSRLLSIPLRRHSSLGPHRDHQSRQQQQQIQQVSESNNLHHHQQQARYEEDSFGDDDEDDVFRRPRFVGRVSLDPGEEVKPPARRKLLEEYVRAKQENSKILSKLEQAQMRIRREQEQKDELVHELHTAMKLLDSRVIGSSGSERARMSSGFVEANDNYQTLIDRLTALNERKKAEGSKPETSGEKSTVYRFAQAIEDLNEAHERGELDSRTVYLLTTAKKTCASYQNATVLRFQNLVYRYLKQRNFEAALTERGEVIQSEREQEDQEQEDDGEMTAEHLVKVRSLLEAHAKRMSGGQELQDKEAEESPSLSELGEFLMSPWKIVDMQMQKFRDRNERMLKEYEREQEEEEEESREKVAEDVKQLSRSILHDLDQKNTSEVKDPVGVIKSVRALQQLASGKTSLRNLRHDGSDQATSGRRRHSVAFAASDHHHQQQPQPPAIDESSVKLKRHRSDFVEAFRDLSRCFTSSRIKLKNQFNADEDEDLRTEPTEQEVKIDEKANAASKIEEQKISDEIDGRSSPSKRASRPSVKSFLNKSQLFLGTNENVAQSEEPEKEEMTNESQQKDCAESEVEFDSEKVVKDLHLQQQDTTVIEMVKKINTTAVISESESEEMKREVIRQKERILAERELLRRRSSRSLRQMQSGVSQAEDRHCRELIARERRKYLTQSLPLMQAEKNEKLFVEAQKGKAVKSMGELPRRGNDRVRSVIDQHSTHRRVAKKSASPARHPQRSAATEVARQSGSKLLGSVNSQTMDFDLKRDLRDARRRLSAHIEDSSGGGKSLKDKAHSSMLFKNKKVKKKRTNKSQLQAVPSSVATSIVPSRSNLLLNHQDNLPWQQALYQPATCDDDNQEVNESLMAILKPVLSTITSGAGSKVRFPVIPNNPGASHHDVVNAASNILRQVTSMASKASLAPKNQTSAVGSKLMITK